MKKLVFLLLVTSSFSVQANFWDSLFGSDDAEATTEEPVKKVSTVEKVADPAPASGTVTQLLPMVTGTLGVTERQARGGLGALFQASRSVLSPQDFQLIEQYVPELDQLVSEAPATNQLLGSAMQMAGIGAGGTAAANLATQFHDLGLGTDMILKYSDLAGDYLKESSPDLASKFTESLAGFLP